MAARPRTPPSPPLLPDPVRLLHPPPHQQKTNKQKGHSKRFAKKAEANRFASSVEAHKVPWRIGRQKRRPRPLLGVRRPMPRRPHSCRFDPRADGVTLLYRHHTGRRLECSTRVIELRKRARRADSSATEPAIPARGPAGSGLLGDRSERPRARRATSRRVRHSNSGAYRMHLAGSGSSEISSSTVCSPLRRPGPVTGRCGPQPRLPVRRESPLAGRHPRVLCRRDSGHPGCTPRRRPGWRRRSHARDRSGPRPRRCRDGRSPRERAGRIPPLRRRPRPAEPGSRLSSPGDCTGEGIQSASATSRSSLRRPFCRPKT